MPRPSTDLQCLAQRQRNHRAHRSLPTMSHMDGLLGFSSTGTAFELVRPLKTAGDIVDSESTVKRRARAGDRFYLKSANPVFPDITPRERLEMYGLVVGCFRSYGSAR